MTSHGDQDEVAELGVGAPPAYRAWRADVDLAPSSLNHVVASDLLRRLIVAGADEYVTRKSYTQELEGLGVSVSPPTIGRAVTELMRRHLVEEGGEVHREGRGRRDTALRLAPFVIGVSVSDAPEQTPPFASADSRPVMKSRAVVVHAVVTTFHGHAEASSATKPVEFHGSDTETDRDAALVRAIVEVLLEVKWEYWHDNRGAPLAGIGVMVGGQVRDHRRVQFSPNIGVADRSLDLPALIAREVESRRAQAYNSGDRYTVSTLDQLAGALVLVENDADAHSRYRTWFGRMSRSADPAMRFVVILLKLDGLGAAYVNQGRAATMAPFELGHTVAATSGTRDLECRCGNTGCLEAVVTPRGMAIQRGLGDKAPSVSAITKLFFEQVRAGNIEALNVLDNAAEALGCALANVMSLGAPEVFYIYAPNDLHDERFTRNVIETAQARAFPGVRDDIDIRFEGLPDHDGDAAAAIAQIVEHTIRQFDSNNDQNSPSDHT